MPRPWGNISDWEFELIAGDLIGEQLEVRFERFPRGPDLGVDRRHIRNDGNVDVVQAKHYRGSGWSQLKHAARKEAERLPQLDPKPASYRFVTSQPLTQAKKTQLREILSPWVERDDYVYGRDDLEGLLDSYPQVERAHVKLWLTSGTQLDALLRPGVHLRSRALAQQIKRTLALYVQGESFFEARALLFERNVLLVAGPPGIGKTTLAHMLVAEAIGEGYEPLAVTDVSEAWDAWNPEVKQILLFDDFLGRTVLGEITNREEGTLLTLLAQVADSPQTRMILTTREYILQQAAITFEGFRRFGLPQQRFMLVLPSYSRLDRAKILHNHVWHSSLPAGVLDELAVDRGYRRIVLHRNFNPRTIEYITGLQPGHPIELRPGDSWLDFAESSLNHPEEIWRQAFTRELGPTAQGMMLCLATLPDEAQVGDLHTAFDAWCDEFALPSEPDRFERTLAIVADTFVATVMREGGGLFCRLENPGLTDYLQRRLMSEPRVACGALRAAVFFEQVLTVIILLPAVAPQITQRAIADGDEFPEAAERLTGARSARWSLSGSYGFERRVRLTATREDRLLILLGLASADNPSPAMRGVAAHVLAERFEAWRRFEGDEITAMNIFRALEGPTEIERPHDWRRVIKELIVHDPYQTQTWTDIAALLDDAPDLFVEGEPDELRQRFSTFASQELTDRIYDMEYLEELDELEVAAERLGVELDERLHQAARETVAEKASERDAIEDQRAEDQQLYWKEELRPVEQAEDRLMDSLFTGRDD